jgi:hypothetical protein
MPILCGTVTAACLQHTTKSSLTHSSRNKFHKQFPYTNTYSFKVSWSISTDLIAKVAHLTVSITTSRWLLLPVHHVKWQSKWKSCSCVSYSAMTSITKVTKILCICAYVQRYGKGVLSRLKQFLTTSPPLILKPVFENKVLKKIYVPKKRLTGNGWKYIMRSFRILQLTYYCNTS